MNIFTKGRVKLISQQSITFQGNCENERGELFTVSKDTRTHKTECKLRLYMKEIKS